MATRPRDRIRGLLGTAPLTDGEALVLTPGRQVHTFGMRRPIDVVFCSREWVVLHVVRSMRPRRMSRFLWSAIFVVELPAGGAAMVETGDRLALEETA